MGQVGTKPDAQGQRHAGQKRGHRGHENRPEAQQAGLVDGVLGAQPFAALGLERKVDHHDGVFLDNADQQDDADQRDDIKVVAAQKQGNQRPHRGRGQRGEYRDRMDEALI